MDGWMDDGWDGMGWDSGPCAAVNFRCLRILVVRAFDHGCDQQTRI